MVVCMVVCVVVCVAVCIDVWLNVCVIIVFYRTTDNRVFYCIALQVTRYFIVSHHRQYDGFSDKQCRDLLLSRERV